VLFVGTKRQAQDPIAAAAQRCGQYYINHRWLGGMLTNWKTISNSIRRLREIAEAFGLTESRICQIHAQTILGLRAYLQRVRER